MAKRRLAVPAGAPLTANAGDGPEHAAMPFQENEADMAKTGVEMRSVMTLVMMAVPARVIVILRWCLLLVLHRFALLR